ncbi:DUF2232 domain-containing protein [Paenibacillus spiritus]|uniref:DUF2232 domain-containing protein n=1 Tax=Paenibacillus spiritus TaxID=2496557 RepID=UPI001CC701B2|nr:DUF2232 domain-containing protein [Paenibacillus spiritus]
MNTLKFRWSSAAWSVAYLFLLLSLSTSLLIITTLFILIPPIVLGTTLGRKQFLASVLPVWVIVGLLSPINIWIAAYFMIPSLVMVRWYRRRSPAFSTIVAGACTILAQFVLLLFIGKVLFSFNLYTYVNDIMNEAIHMTVSPLGELGAGSSLFTDLGLNADSVDEFSARTVQILPMAMIVFSAVISVLTHSIVRPILGSMGYVAPRMRPAREWRLPKSLVWYYLIGFLLQMLSGGNDSSPMAMIAFNLLLLLQIGFMIQAIGFFFFIAHERGWNKTLPILLAIPIILLPPLRIIGIIDLVFPLREMVTKSRR